jgi:hypothetical protein
VRWGKQVDERGRDVSRRYVEAEEGGNILMMRMIVENVVECFVRVSEDYASFDLLQSWTFSTGWQRRRRRRRDQIA